MVADPNKGKRDSRTRVGDDRPSRQQDNLDQPHLARTGYRSYGTLAGQHVSDRHGDNQRARKQSRDTHHRGRSRSPDRQRASRYNKRDRYEQIYPDHYSPPRREQTGPRRRSPPSPASHDRSAVNRTPTRTSSESLIHFVPATTAQSSDTVSTAFLDPTRPDLYIPRAGLGSEGANLGDAADVLQRRVKEEVERDRRIERGRLVIDEVRANAREIGRRARAAKYVERTKESARERFFKE